MTKPFDLSAAFDNAVAALREKVGGGRCPTCGEHADSEHSDVAKGGRVMAGCPNGHRWLVDLSGERPL